MKVACLHLLFMIKGMTGLILNEGLNSSNKISKREVQLYSCDKGWYLFGDNCYKTGGSRALKLNWQKSSEKCRELGGTLASIHSKDLLDFITAFILMNLRQPAWIGLNDRRNESNFEWEDGSDFDFENWMPGEPSVGHETDNCVQTVAYNSQPGFKLGHWYDVDCGHEMSFICQKKEKKQARKLPDPRFCSDGTSWKLGTSCYNVVEQKLAWQDAEDYCIEKHSGHLVTINDYFADLFLDYILRNYTDEMWIGIKIKNEFQQRWSSGWYVAFTNWMDEPREFLDGTCTIRASDNKWKTVSCDRRLPFICETSTEIAPTLTSPDGSFCPLDVDGWRDLGGEFCYHINTEPLSYSDASFSCVRRGGYLASFHSQAEMDVLKPFLAINFLNGLFYPWIGLYRSIKHGEEFAWMDGTPVDFKAWAAYEGNEEHKKCVDIKVESMTWGAWFCDPKRTSICSIRKTAPTNRTTDSTPLRSSISSVSVNKTTTTSSYIIGFSVEVFFCVTLCCLFVAVILPIIVCRYYTRKNKLILRRNTPPHPHLDSCGSSRQTSDFEIGLAVLSLPHPQKIGVSRPISDFEIAKENEVFENHESVTNDERNLIN